MNTKTVDKESTKQRCSRKCKRITTEYKDPSQNFQKRKQKALLNCCYSPIPKITREAIIFKILRNQS
jgi:hypothetical protein